MNVSSSTAIRFAVLVREGDEIFHLWRNKRSEFLSIFFCLHVLEKNYGRGDNFSREHNLSLESDIPAMKILKLFSILEGQVG